MEKRALTRRQFMRGALFGAAGVALAACGATPTPQVVEKVVTQVVKETSVVEVTKVVASTPEVIKETVVVERTVPVTVQAPVTIEVWWWVGPTQEGVIKVFQEMNPKITVDLVDLGEAVYGTPKFTTAVAAGHGPDVAYQNRHTFQQFSARNLYLPIDDLFQRDGYKRDDFPANQMQTLTWNGTLYGLADQVGMRFFYWNRKHFEEAGLDPNVGPQTWDDIIEFSQKLIKKTGDTYDRYAFIPGFPPGLKDQLLIFALENGGVTKDPTGRKSMIDAPEWVEALDWCVKYTDQYCGGFEGASGTMQGFAGQAQDMFASGKISMSSYGDWMMGTYAAYPDLDYDGFATMPTSASYKGHKVNWACDWSWAMTQKKGGHVEEGWTFIKYAISADRFKAESTVGMQLAAEQWKRENLPGTPIYYAEPPAYAPAREWVTKEIYGKYPERLAKMAANNADAAVWSPECGILGGLAATELWTEMATAWEKAMSHTASPQEAMATAAANHQKALDDAWAQIEKKS